ncbi:hypothetical protein GOP47_0010018, partial [Adiantum capillus-veneris]
EHYRHEPSSPKMKASSVLALAVISMVLVSVLLEGAAAADVYKKKPRCVSRLPHPDCDKSPVDGSYTNICSCCRKVGGVTFCPRLYKKLAAIKDVCARIRCATSP